MADTRHIPFGSGSGRQTVLVVSYRDGVLFIDPKSEHGFHEATRLVDEPDWKDGKPYAPFNTRGFTRLNNVNFHMEIVPIGLKRKQ